MIKNDKYKINVTTEISPSYELKILYIDFF